MSSFLVVPYLEWNWIHNTEQLSSGACGLQQCGQELSNKLRPSPIEKDPKSEAFMTSRPWSRVIRLDGAVVCDPDPGCSVLDEACYDLLQ